MATRKQCEYSAKSTTSSSAEYTGIGAILRNSPVGFILWPIRILSLYSTEYCVLWIHFRTSLSKMTENSVVARSFWEGRYHSSSRVWHSCLGQNHGECL